MTKKYFISLILISLGFILFSQSNNGFRPDINVRGPEFTYKSELSDGTIYKLAIGTTGVYKISYEFLSNTDLKLGSEVSSLKLLTNRGGLIPESLSAERSDDLIEIPYFITGNNNSLDPGEFMVFYAEGADAFKISDNEVSYEKNIYDINNFIFLKQDNTERRQFTIKSIDDFPQREINTYLKYQRYEEDKTNLLGQFTSTQGSGKFWYGDYFNISRERSYSPFFNFQHLVLNSPLQVTVGFAGRGITSHKLNLKINNSVSEFDISSVRIDNLESKYASHITVNKSLTINQENVLISLEYPNQNNNEGWLDFIETRSAHNLNFENVPLIFIPDGELNSDQVLININGKGDHYVWEITNPLDIVQYTTRMNADKIQFVTTLDKLRKYIIFNPESVVNTPASIEKIENQNLHALSDVELLIIYHPDFEEDALALADFRISQGVNAIPVSVDKIYNEFGGGKKDPVSIRDFAKMIYDRSSNFRYLLLIGDGSYDYRNLTPGLDDQNFIPVYETDESLHPIESFPSDDFYALLSDNDGADLRGQLEIAVGRLPVKTKSEARIVVDKLIRYDSDPKTLGSWRLNIGFTADDEDFNTHFNQSETIAKDLEIKFPEYNQQKIYFDAFQQVSTSGGARYPEASSKLSENIYNGQLVLNYLGHGGPRGWAQERVLKVNDILSWDNYYKLPLLITATCSFTGYDDPGLVSAGEYALLSEKGGAIGLLTTVRAVYSNDNFRLTSAVFDTLLTSGNNEELTIGDIMIRSKNQNWQDTTRINARKFALIGDPSLKLAIPKFKVSTTSINSIPVAEFRDTINALDKVSVEGFIADKNGEIIPDFKGNLFSTVYDKHTKLVTLRNDSRSRESQFEQLNAVIFKGSTDIKDGKFKFEFIVPKDINYTFGPGKISYYAVSDQNEDASGYFSNLIIGGSGNASSSDQKGPEIQLFMNDEIFVSGGVTDNSPTLLVKLYDESGINVTGNGIGHDLTAILDENNQNVYILNQFYESKENDFREGSASFPLSSLNTGMHVVRVKAWDVFNNSSEKELSFLVVNDENNQIYNLYNYPNPFTDETTFSFEHDITGTDVSVTVEIYNSAGQQVKILSQSVFSSGYRIDGIQWDGESGLGTNLSAGIYVYRVKVKNNQGEERSSSFQKMILLR